ncbi:hypothetical protein XHV734_2769 [Xanthomonas hortorum pv. vitians]|nr:hypothetical protein XHV734_2769 [Xanthomonas hortorum pv. vitians]
MHLYNQLAPHLSHWSKDNICNFPSKH